MKKPELKAGMDCSNLRTRAGTEVLFVRSCGKMESYPFIVYYMSIDGMEFDSHVTRDGRYWADSHDEVGEEHQYDILELEEEDMEPDAPKEEPKTLADLIKEQHEKLEAKGKVVGEWAEEPRVFVKASTESSLLSIIEKAVEADMGPMGKVNFIKTLLMLHK